MFITFDDVRINASKIRTYSGFIMNLQDIHSAQQQYRPVPAAKPRVIVTFDNGETETLTGRIEDFDKAINRVSTVRAY